jgi:hypothetical protein
MFETPEYSILHYKFFYMIINSLSLMVVLWKIYGMGLIPLNPADWISIVDLTVPPVELIKLR